MPDVLFLKVTQAQDATSQNRPKLLLLKFSLLEDSFINLIFKRTLRELPQNIQLVKRHTVLILLATYDLLQRDQVAIICQLFLPPPKKLFSLPQRLPVLATDLPQEVLLLR